LLCTLLLLPFLSTPSVAQAGDLNGKEQAQKVASDSEQVAHFALSNPPAGFDPVRNTEMIDAVMQRQVLECLTEYDYLAQDSTITGQLADSWSVSKDGLEWRLHLKEQARFYDPFEPPLWPSRSRAVTAHDVLFCWLRQADARSNSQGFWAMDGVFLGMEDFRTATGALDPAVAEQAMADALKNGIAGIQVVSDFELLLRLKQPDPKLLNRLAMSYFAVYPFEAVTKDGRSMRDEPVGSAPFSVQYWLPEQTLLLERTPDWRKEESPFGEGEFLPYLDRVEFRVVRDVHTRNEMFQAGSIDRIAVGNSARNQFLNANNELQQEFQQRGMRLLDYQRPDTTMLCFGMEDSVVGDLPGDPEGNAKRKLLSRALALAFPYDRWHADIRNNFPSTRARSFLPPMVPGAAQLPASAWNHLDLKLAAELLAEAGYPKGRDLPELEFLLSGTDTVSVSIGKFYVASLKRIGVKCKAVPLSYREQIARSRSGNAQMFLRAWVLDWPDGALVLQNFHSPQANTGVNLSRFMDPEFDTLFEQYRALPEGQQRTALLLRMHLLLEDRVPAVAIDHRRARLLVQPWLDHFYVHPFNAFFCKYYRIGNH
jgi:ABC-type transport system substrate-binding protein